MYWIKKHLAGRWPFIAIFLFISFQHYGQITPPGLGRGSNADVWLAAGLRQNLDSAGKIQSMTYLGLGRESTPENFRSFQHQGILVVNQELYVQANKNWQYSVALSYRKQNEYKDVPPYERASPAFKQELRAYSRLTYAIQKQRVRLALTARQEIREFFTPDFEKWEEKMQLRSRIKPQMLIHLSPDKKHNLTVAAEALFTTSLKSDESHWTRFRYSETRLSGFYTLSPKKSRVAYSIGYMYDIVGLGSEIKHVNYFAFDLVFKNLFSTHKSISRKKTPAV